MLTLSLGEDVLVIFVPKYRNILLLRYIENYMRGDTMSYSKGIESLSSPVHKICLDIVGTVYHL